MKPLCEKVLPDENSSWRFCRYDWQEMEFNWHYHPEYEICLTLGGQGLRYMGDHIGQYHEWDLVLIGPDMPHAWQSKLSDTPQTVYVAQIPAAWLHQQLTEQPELAVLGSLLERAGRGLLFSDASARAALPLFQAMEQASPYRRLLLLLQLLELMLADSEACALSSTLYANSGKQEYAVKKLDRVIEYIYENYTNDLNAQELARLAHMSTNHFHRFFKKRTEKTLTEFINQLRIAKACKLLITQQSPISAISDQCGFNNLSNFNRRFLQLKGIQPSQFRQRFRGKPAAI